MSRRPMERILALRLLQEERAEVELSKQRLLQQACLKAMQASQENSAVALRALHAGLEAGDRAAAIVAEMALSFGPLERYGLQRRLTSLGSTVEAATMEWQSARMCRMQIQTLVDSSEAARVQDEQLREQKALDAWILSDRNRVDEKVQREETHNVHFAGTKRAGTTQE